MLITPMLIDQLTNTDFVSDEGEKRVIFDGYFGGVTLFPIMDYYKVNGYSNDYWGWGYEDDDILFRCKENFFDLNLKHQPIKTWNTTALEFNGWDSEVKIPMKFGCDNYTILLECEPQHIDLRKELDMDEYSILSIPGYDTDLHLIHLKDLSLKHLLPQGNV